MQLQYELNCGSYDQDIKIYQSATLMASKEHGDEVYKKMFIKCFNSNLQQASAFLRHNSSLLVRFHKLVNNKARTLKMQHETISHATICRFKAARKIINKYEKVHGSISCEKFISDIHEMSVGSLKSPWMLELIALHMNLTESRKVNAKRKLPSPSLMPQLFEQCFFKINNEGHPTLFASLSNSRHLNIDLTCSICLETIFDPVSLPCSHLFCYMCACSAASVPTVIGLNAASSQSRCPLCRKEGVFRSAVRMKEMNFLLSQKMPEYWQERRQTERKARLKEAKQYWASYSQAFSGFQ